MDLSGQSGLKWSDGSETALQQDFLSSVEWKSESAS